MKEYIKKEYKRVSKLIYRLTRITFAFLACAILFQLTTNVKLFGTDVVANSSAFLEMLGTQIIVGILAIITLAYLIRKK